MAGNIDLNASFSINNMKPANNEEITSLWGKNMADNTGHLVGRRTWMPFALGTNGYELYNSKSNTDNDKPFVFEEDVCKQSFFLPEHHTTLVGTWTGIMYMAGAFPTNNMDGTMILSIEGDSGTYTESHSDSETGEQDFTFSDIFNLDIDVSPYVQGGSWGRLVIRQIGTVSTSADPFNENNFMSHGLNNFRFTSSA